MTLTPSMWQRVREGRAPDPGLVADVVHEEVGALGAGRVAASREALASRVLGAGVLEPWLARPGVTDVAVNGDGRVWVDRGHGMEWVGEVIEPDEARALAVRLAGLAGRRLDEASPWVDGQLPSGARLHAVLPPLVAGGPHITIRVPSSEQIHLPGLLDRSMFPRAWQDVLERIVRRRLSFVVSGGTGAGKTTLLAALLGGVDPAERILVVEDVRELHVEHPHVVRLEARPANVEGAGEVTLETLVRQALRMRPDRIVVGEVRGAEVRELLAALNTGHEGGCGTVHANAPEDVIARFEALGALAGLGPDGVRAQLAAAVDLVIHVARRGGTDQPGSDLPPGAPLSDASRGGRALGREQGSGARFPGDASSEAGDGVGTGTRHVAAIAAVFRRETGLSIVPALAWDGPGHAWTREAAWPALAARLDLPVDYTGSAGAPALARTLDCRSALGVEGGPRPAIVPDRAGAPTWAELS
ncbi:type II secretion system protein E [Intrasporangium oryzae NRRL B-24470]|uniref:Type II secretion system protein E n=1 Tax=Intrasporangium oryzae NRRL B-24470 TaxID=1386089 RepID=W9GIE8_9MICO|nr:TadA family conjugal transfer-associated ATPase [Intrasporangium oryzae]EWT03664.1 type II secretion system protein E [Intrasporangium oryzae NRRL B-24470]